MEIVMPEKITGAEILIRCLLEEGATVVFGYPGGQVIPLFDKLAMYHDKLQFYLPRHEQGGAHEAEGYARATGKVGVCIATSGPGATNLVTGIANAYMDSVPIVFITGQVPTHMIGNDAFQEVDITGITRPVTKHNFLVKDVNDLAQTMKNAFHIARSGRPGPVLVDVPSDVQRAMTEWSYPAKNDIVSYNPTTRGNPLQLKRALEMIAESKKPVIYAGGGVILSNASAELRAFAEKTGIPVTMTLLGLGVFPGDHELSLDMLGMHGTQYANKTILECDLIIAIGARFDDRVTGKMDEFAPHAKIIHIDIDPTSIGKSIEVDLPIVGDVKEVLAGLNREVKKCDIAPWTAHVKELKKTLPLKYDKSDAVIKPQQVLEELDRLTKGGAVVVTDVGQHQMWAAQFYKYTRPRSFISSGGLGTMGYGLPAAIGAKIGCPKETVVLISGDGSIQMNIQELATASLYEVPVKIIILNNNFLGMVRQWQELFWNRRYASTYLQGRRTELLNYEGLKHQCVIPDFCKVAEAYCIPSINIVKPSELTRGLERMLAEKGPVLVNVAIPPEENVMPMVPPGKAMSEMLA
jgi:acetolactate synthase-1/2/3 large subunit